MKQAKLKRRVCLTYLAKVFKHDTNQYAPDDWVNDTTIWRVTQKYFDNAGWFDFTGKCEISIENWPIWFPGYTVYQFPVNLAQVNGGKIAVFVMSSSPSKNHTILEFNSKAQKEINSFGTWFGELNALTQQFSCGDDEIKLHTG